MEGRMEEGRIVCDGEVFEHGYLVYIYWLFDQ